MSVALHCLKYKTGLILNVTYTGSISPKYVFWEGRPYHIAQSCQILESKLGQYFEGRPSKEDCADEVNGKPPLPHACLGSPLLGTL